MKISMVRPVREGYLWFIQGLVQEEGGPPLVWLADLSLDDDPLRVGGLTLQGAEAAAVMQFLAWWLVEYRLALELMRTQQMDWERACRLAACAGA